MKEFLISIFPMAQGVANVKVLFYRVQSSSSSTGEEDNFHLLLLLPFGQKKERTQKSNTHTQKERPEPHSTTRACIYGGSGH